MSKRLPSLTFCYIGSLILLSGCVTTSTLPEMAWVRTDGRKITDDPALLQQGKSDIAACDANLSIAERQPHRRADAWPRRGDDTSWVKPQVQLWCESVQSWVRLTEETRNFLRGMTA